MSVLPGSPHRPAEVLRDSPAELLHRLAQGRPYGGKPLTHVRRIPASAGQVEDWPGWVPAELVNALAVQGITMPWRHQVAAADLAVAGTSVVVATGTASGKSLAYQLPVLATLLADPKATALYLAPTKALAADQLRSLTELAMPDVRPAMYDGDTPTEEREWVRRHARLLFTNPDIYALFTGADDGGAARRFDTSGAERLVAEVGLVVEQVHGVRVVSDLVPGAALDNDPGAGQALLDFELAAAAVAPYRDVAAQLHLLARRRAAP